MGKNYILANGKRLAVVYLLDQLKQFKCEISVKIILQKQYSGPLKRNNLLLQSFISTHVRKALDIIYLLLKNTTRKGINLHLWNPIRLKRHHLIFKWATHHPPGSTKMATDFNAHCRSAKLPLPLPSTPHPSIHHAPWLSRRHSLGATERWRNNDNERRRRHNTVTYSWSHLGDVAPKYYFTPFSTEDGRSSKQIADIGFKFIIGQSFYNVQIE